MGLRKLGVVAVLALALASNGAQAAVIYEVTLSGSFLDGLAGTLAFDFIDGGPPANTVDLGTLASSGTQSSSTTTGDVTGTGPWQFGDGSFFSELLVAYTAFGPTLTFRFTATTNAPDPGASPDAFSLLILAADLLSSLVTTDDPTGANALFLYEAGMGLTVYTPLQQGVNISVERIAAVPEPGVFALLAAACLALGWQRRILRRAAPPIG